MRKSSQMLSRLYRFRHSRFLRGSATLSGGQMIATAIGFLCAPILARLYSPADYGVLATYMAFAVILGAVSTLQMQRAIVAEADEERAEALLGLSLRLAIGTATLTLAGVGIALFGGHVSVPSVGMWLALLPATVLASGTGSALVAWANRHHRYKLMSSFQIGNVAVASGMSMLLGWLGFGPSGLMIGYFLGQLASFLLVLGANMRVFPRLLRLTRAEMLSAGKPHRGYALWGTPTAVNEQVAAASPILVLSLWGNMLGIVGHYNRARSLVALPVGILGGAISQVFFRRAAEDVAKHGHCRPLFFKVVSLLLAASIPIFTVLALIAPTLFAVVLGPAWREAGDIVRIIAPVMALQLVVMPVSKVLWLYQRQRLDFLLSISFTSSTTLAVASIALLGFAPLTAIYAFAAMQSLMYLSYLFSSVLVVERSYRLANARPTETAEQQ